MESKLSSKTKATNPVKDLPKKSRNLELPLLGQTQPYINGLRSPLYLMKPKPGGQKTRSTSKINSFGKQMISDAETRRSSMEMRNNTKLAIKTQEDQVVLKTL